MARPPRTLLLVTALLTTLLAGCAAPTPSSDGLPGQEEQVPTVDIAAGVWPDLTGRTLTILDHGAFPAFTQAASAFTNLTGATVEQLSADDTGSALNLALQEAGDPTFDVLYGIDNILWHRAVEAGIFEPYRPVLADRIDPAYLFFDPDQGWHATPVDHGFIAINWDPTHERLQADPITDLDAVARNADLFVTQDPRTSTPGLGYLLATIAVYGEEGADTWREHWIELFEGGVLITSGWTEAYEQHFSAGYGADYGGLADKPIVTSYTESPAYEAFFGRPAEALAVPLTAPGTTFHQVQTMGIMKGTDELAAAQAWIEFTLTDAFQELAAPSNAVYPVVAGIDTDATYGEHDPEPGTFEPADLSPATIGANLERWITEWVALCEAHGCA